MGTYTVHTLYTPILQNLLDPVVKLPAQNPTQHVVHVLQKPHIQQQSNQENVISKKKLHVCVLKHMKH